MTKASGKLPSLRYGTLGIETSRSSNRNHLSFPSRFYPDSFNFFKRSATTTLDKMRKGTDPAEWNSTNKVRKVNGLTRHVRFHLPDIDGDVIINAKKQHNNHATTDAGVDDANKSKIMAGESHLRSCSSHPQRLSHNRRDARCTREAKASTRRSGPEGSTYGACKSNKTRGYHFVEHMTYSEHITAVLVTASPGVRLRIHPTGHYLRGTLSPTANSLPLAVVATPTGQALLRAARDGDDLHLKELLREAALTGVLEKDLNAVDSSGREDIEIVIASTADWEENPEKWDTKLTLKNKTCAYIKKIAAVKNKLFRTIVNAPYYVRNTTIQNYLEIETIEEFIAKVTTNHLGRQDLTQIQESENHTIDPYKKSEDVNHPKTRNIKQDQNNLQ